MLKSQKFHRWLSIGLLAMVMGYLGYLLSGCNSSEDNPPAANPVVATQNSLATAIALQSRATEQPTATNVVITGGNDTPTYTPSPTNTSQATSESSPTQTASPTSLPTLSLDEAASSSGIATAVAMAQTIPNEHFWLVRPFLTESGIVDNPERIYAYGSTNAGQLRPHYGIDIVNPFGTRVLAAREGMVFFAGDDFNEKLFGPQSNFYGNTVVLQHTYLLESGQPFVFYTLYGHLSSINVEKGQSVRVFDPIGQIGQTGAAFGPHLHLEVRIGDPYDYGATYNPELWLEQYAGYGILAGRVERADGTPLYDVEIKAESTTSGAIYRAYTYTETDPALNGDPTLHENWVLGDLEAGTYEITVGYLGRVVYNAEVTIIGGTTGFLAIVVE